MLGGPDASEGERAQQQIADLQAQHDEVAADKDAAQAEIRSLKRRIGQLDRDLATARHALAAQDAPAEQPLEAEAADAPAEEPTAALGNGQTYSFPEYDEALASIDWNDVGTHVAAMAPLLSEIMTAVARGEQPSPEAIGGAQQHNGPLVTVAMTLHGELPGETVNGAFTHPAVVVNTIVSTLETVGMPLDPDQIRALERVGNDYVAEDRQRLAAYTGETLTLQRQLDESLLKGRFYDAAMAILSDEQHEAIRPAATRGRMTVDLFSAALVWVGRAKPVPFQTRAALGERLGERLAQDLGTDGETRARVAQVVADWVDGLPEDMMVREPDALWLKGMMPIDAIDRAAEQQIVLIERLIRDCDLPEHAVAELRSHSGAMVPTWRPQQ
jgi:hypothetical protein